MAEELSKRDLDKIFIASGITWMQQAFKDHPGPILNLINDMQIKFHDVIESYEGEIECLKHALPADNDTQIASLLAPVDTVEE